MQGEQGGERGEQGVATAPPVDDALYSEKVHELEERDPHGFLEHEEHKKGGRSGAKSKGCSSTRGCFASACMRLIARSSEWGTAARYGLGSGMCGSCGHMHALQQDWVSSESQETLELEQAVCR